VSTPPVFLDTNVFMYAADAPHPYTLPCVRILADVETGTLVAASNSEVLEEILYRYHRIGDADTGIRLCRDDFQCKADQTACHSARAPRCSSPRCSTMWLSTDFNYTSPSRRTWHKDERRGNEPLMGSWSSLVTRWL